VLAVSRAVSVVLQYKSEKSGTDRTVEKRVEKRPTIHHESIDDDYVSRHILNPFRFIIEQQI